MGRDIRYLPRRAALVELTLRTVQRRYLFRPGPRLNRLIVGVLARATKLTGMRVQAVSVQSNHLHLLASPESVEQMATFMRHLGTNLSKEVGRLHDWSGPMFERRYTSIPVSDEPEAQIARLRYLLAQGTAENLILSPADWPGVQSAETLVEGKPLRGVWIDRTALYAARQRGDDVGEAEFETEVELALEALPCWAHLPPVQYRDRVHELVEAIEHETIERHRHDGTAPLGATWVCSRHPHERPKPKATTPRPRFHAFRKRVRDALVGAYRSFLVAYRAAAARLLAGDTAVSFPENCYPSRLPFVPFARLEPG